MLPQLWLNTRSFALYLDSMGTGQGALCCENEGKVQVLAWPRPFKGPFAKDPLLRNSIFEGMGRERPQFEGVSTPPRSSWSYGPCLGAA